MEQNAQGDEIVWGLLSEIGSGVLSADWGTGADVLSAAADWALAATAIVSAVIAVSSYGKAQQARREEHEKIQDDIRHRNWVDAKGLYLACLDDQLNDPVFRPSNWPAVKKYPKQEYRYRVFMNKLLWSLEGMLEVDSPNAEWRRSAKDIGRAWVSFFQDPEFLTFEWYLYSRQLRKAIAAGVKSEGVENFACQVKNAKRNLKGRQSSRRSSSLGTEG